MTRGKISAGRRWFTRVFPGWSGPDEIDDIALLTTPLNGSGRYSDIQYDSKISVAVTSVNFDTVPDDKQWWIPYAEGRHTDSVLTTDLWIGIRNAANSEVSVAAGNDLKLEQRVVVDKPFIVPEAHKLYLNSRTVIGAGQFLALLIFYVEMPLGEFVPPI